MHGHNQGSQPLVEASVGRLSSRAVGGSSLRESPLRERRCTQLAVWRGGRTAGRWRGARGRRGREQGTASTRKRNIVETLQRSHANWPAKQVVTADSTGVHCPEKCPAADDGSEPTSGGRYGRNEAVLTAQLLEDGHLQRERVKLRGLVVAAPSPSKRVPRRSR